MRSLPHAVWCILLAVSSFVATAQEPATPATGALALAPSARYMRVDDSDPDRIKLQISSRTLVPVSGTGASVELVGVVHVADAAYYRELQTFLDGFDLVLYEGVKLSGLGNAPPGLDADQVSRVMQTKSRLRKLAVLIQRTQARGEPLPESLSSLVGALESPIQHVATSLLTDAWGHPVIYTWSTTTVGDQPPRSTYDLHSLGADGADGGGGAAADLSFSAQEPLGDHEKRRRPSPMSKLASALGLEFQSAMDYTRAKWRNSDLAIDVLRQKLKAIGAPGEEFLDFMDGTSGSLKAGLLLLGFVERDPNLAMMGKLMLVETGRDDAKGDANPERDARKQVILIDRNTEVLQDLRRVIDDEPLHGRIALFYGAGHMPDFEYRLVNEFGYRFAAARWFTALEVDLRSAPGGLKQGQQLQRMVRKSAENRGSRKRAR